LTVPYGYPTYPYPNPTHAYPTPTPLPYPPGPYMYGYPFPPYAPFVKGSREDNGYPFPPYGLFVKGSREGKPTTTSTYPESPKSVAASACATNSPEPSSDSDVDENEGVDRCKLKHCYNYLIPSTVHPCIACYCKYLVFYLNHRNT